MKINVVVFVCLLIPVLGFPQGNFTSGNSTVMLVSKSKMDTAVLTIDFTFYTNPGSQGERAVNDAILADVKEWDNGNTTKTVSPDVFDQKLNNFVEMYREAEKEEGDPMIWSFMESIDIREMDSWIQLKLASWSYEGGAHGNGGESYTLYDRESGRVLKAEDFFTDVDELNTILEGYFRKDKNIPSNQGLSDAGFSFDDDTFKINDNFYFTGRSLVVYFNTYEITDYASGPTELEVSLDKIEHLLKREF